MRILKPIRPLIIVLLAAFATLSLLPASASSANISRSYLAATQISKGSLVSLDPKRTDYVQPANSSNGARLIGAVVAINDSLLAVDPTEGKIQVATSGSADVLASTLNGPIKVGDQVAVSPFNGVGMKASPGSRVIGLAQSAFDGTASGGSTQQVTDKDGQTSSIQVGYVRVSIVVGSLASNNSDAQLNSLQKVAKYLTGHAVSTPRVIVALVVALVALISLITLIYASIYGSIISIGRNPLAKYAVFRTLWSVLGMASLTALIAGLTIFFLLR